LLLFANIVTRLDVRCAAEAAIRETACQRTCAASLSKEVQMTHFWKASLKSQKALAEPPAQMLMVQHSYIRLSRLRSGKAVANTAGLQRSTVRKIMRLAEGLTRATRCNFKNRCNFQKHEQARFSMSVTGGLSVRGRCRSQTQQCENVNDRGVCNEDYRVRGTLQASCHTPSQ
jgi:hypothetical protein